VPADHLAPATLALLRDEFRTLFKDLNDVPWTEGSSATPPAVDVIDTPSAVEVRVDLLAFGPTTLSVDIDGRDLTIRGSRRVELEEKAGGSRRAKHRVRHFLRQIELPRDLGSVGCAATYRSGLLEIVLTKPAGPSRSRRV